MKRNKYLQLIRQGKAGQAIEQLNKDGHTVPKHISTILKEYEESILEKNPHLKKLESKVYGKNNNGAIQELIVFINEVEKV